MAQANSTALHSFSKVYDLHNNSCREKLISECNQNQSQHTHQHQPNIYVCITVQRTCRIKIGRAVPNTMSNHAYPFAGYEPNAAAGQQDLGGDFNLAGATGRAARNGSVWRNRSRCSINDGLTAVAWIKVESFWTRVKSSLLLTRQVYYRLKRKRRLQQNLKTLRWSSGGGCWLGKMSQTYHESSSRKCQLRRDLKDCRG